MSIRARLALWYGILLSAVLAASLSIAYVVHASAHANEVDASLRTSWEHAVEDLGTPAHHLGVALSPPPATSGGPSALRLFESGARAPVAETGSLGEPSLTALAWEELRDGYATTSTPSGPVRTYAAAVPGSDLRIVVASSVAALEMSLERLRLILLAMGVLGVGAAVGGGWAISSGALRPVATLTETARAIALSRGFSRRVPVGDHGRDELAELGRTFNGMLASLDDAYRRQQRFVGEVSHELRTPLTTIQGNAEILARPELDGEERRAAATLVLREAGRLARLADDLLVLARADAGPQPFLGKPVQLDEVLMEAFAELRPQAGERLRVADLEAAVVTGERDRLKQLVLVLVDNALRYTPAEGTVALSLSADRSEAVLRVEDEGVGIRPEETSRVFERFYRGETARRLDPSGTGLGLAIARWIVERHGGSIALAPREPKGTRATARLPLAA